MIGATREAIDTAEDRERFREAMRSIGLEVPHSELAHSMDDARRIQGGMGFPIIIRPSFTLGGSGGGIAYNREEFADICERGLDASPTREILLEESVLGWKEFEMEVVRDRKDNCIIVCSIENVDAMGVHTGDSITVAPAQTLTDKEYQMMRNASIAVLRKVGVDTGGSNVQFAVHPENGRLVVIEMNPRVSRSSALASKATGFPIAHVAAKLAVGYTLDELDNQITGGATPASFEPSIDYVVTKVPRFNFDKFPEARAPAHHPDALGGRGDGDRAELPGVAAEGVAQPGNGTRRTRRDRSRRRRGRFRASARRASCAGTGPDSLRRRRLSARIHGGGGACALRDRSLVRGTDRGAGGDRGRSAAHGRGAARRRGVPSPQAQGFLGSPPRLAARGGGRRPAFPPPRLRGAPGLQASGLLRGGVSGLDRISLLHLRGGVRVGPDGAGEDHGARRRAEPDRPGNRVRLLLRAGGARGSGRRLRVDHGELQPGDGIHGLRRLGSALLRAPDARRPARDRRQGEAPRHHRPVRRSDPAQARAGARGGRRPHHRHLAGFHRPRGRPGTLSGDSSGASG